MRDPFKIEQPTCISFSGGRTSAYMLWRVLQANGGLPADAVVCFANTGKEVEATLRFVRDCAERWQMPIHWLEYLPMEPGFMLVDFERASRQGEPFEALIRKRQYLPNPVARGCTTSLKIRPMHRFLRHLGWTDWDQMIGIRADEHHLAHVRDIEQAGLGAGVGVLLEDAGRVLHRHLVAGEGHHLGAEGDVQVVQRGAQHGRGGIVVAHHVSFVQWRRGVSIQSRSR